MIIYFVNRCSKIKGPFDITDSYRQHIIKVGDICLRDTTGGIAFYVIYNSCNSWDSCKVVGIGENDGLSDIGNTLLFSFDGLSRRKGDIALIKLLRMSFREKVIDDFFCNAIDILKYKKDFWEGSLFPRFFASSQVLVDRNEKKKSDISNEMNRYPSVFAKYLSKDLQDLLTTSLNEGNELKEAYLTLREKYPEMFRKALMQFLTDNPNGTIYDKPANTFAQTLTVPEVETTKTTYHNDNLVEIDERIDDGPFEINKQIDSFFIEINRESLLSVDEEIELAQKTRMGEIDARNKLVRANLRFVAGIAKQYLHKGLEFDDLLQEGFLGLIKAAERFDETRGYYFIHYVPWWIKSYLTNAIVKDFSLIKYPLSVQTLHRRVWDFKIKYEQKNGFLPSITEIKIDDEDNLERISFLDSLPKNLKNTCIPCEDLDVFEDSHNDILDYENNEKNKYYVRCLLNRLSKRERNILIRVFGIGVREETLEIIGESHGLSRERVRQIKEKAIKKLREMILVTSAKGQLSKNQSKREKGSTNLAVTAKNTEETQTLREVKKTFSQNKIVQFAGAKSSISAKNDSVILHSEKSKDISRKEGDLDTRIYTIVNYNGKCDIYDYNKKLVYSSTGSVKEINKSYYKVSLTYFFCSIRLIKRNQEEKFFNGTIILLANRQSSLHHKLNCKAFIEMIDDIELDGRRRVKVGGCWFDENGNEVFKKNNTDSKTIEHHEVKKESIDGISTRKPEIPNEINEFIVEHVFVDTFEALPYRDVEVATEQPYEDKAAEGEETLPIWAVAENIRFAKRSKLFLKCKCCVGLSKTGYYLMINRSFIKLGDYPSGYEYNVGNIWIKRPIDDKGYRMVHENEKGDHLIGYAIEKGDIVVFTTPSKTVHSVTFDGRIISGVKNKEAISLKDDDFDILQHAFDKKATSYKYFWFLAILNIYKENRNDPILFKDILIVMVSLAWKYVFVENSKFPKIDQLPCYLRIIQEKSHLDRYAKESRVLETVRAHYYEWNCYALLIPLLNNVPYRFLSPWLPFTNKEEVIAKSKKTESKCPYSIAKDHVTINPLWSDYLVKNYDNIYIFIEKELRSYLKCK